MIGSINRAISTCLKEMLLFGLQSSFLKPLSSGICQCARGKRVFAWWSLDFLHKTRGNIYIYIYIFAWLITKKQPLTQNAENLFFFLGSSWKTWIGKTNQVFEILLHQKTIPAHVCPFFSHHGCWKSWPSTLLWCKAVSTWIVPTFTPYFVRIACNIDSLILRHGKCTMGNVDDHNHTFTHAKTSLTPHHSRRFNLGSSTAWWRLQSHVYDWLNCWGLLYMKIL